MGSCECGSLLHWCRYIGVTHVILFANASLPGHHRDAINSYSQRHHGFARLRKLEGPHESKTASESVRRQCVNRYNRSHNFVVFLRVRSSSSPPACLPCCLLANVGFGKTCVESGAVMVDGWHGMRLHCTVWNQPRAHVTISGTVHHRFRHRLVSWLALVCRLVRTTFVWCVTTLATGWGVAYALHHCGCAVSVLVANCLKAQPRCQCQHSTQACCPGAASSSSRYRWDRQVWSRSEAARPTFVDQSLVEHGKVMHSRQRFECLPPWTQVNEYLMPRGPGARQRGALHRILQLNEFRYAPGTPRLLQSGA